MSAVTEIKAEIAKLRRKAIGLAKTARELESTRVNEIRDLRQAITSILDSLDVIDQQIAVDLNTGGQT